MKHFFTLVFSLLSLLLSVYFSTTSVKLQPIIFQNTLLTTFLIKKHCFQSKASIWKSTVHIYLNGFSFHLHLKYIVNFLGLKIIIITITITIIIISTFFLLSNPLCDIDWHQTLSSRASNKGPTFTVQTQKEMLIDKTLLSELEYVIN